MNDHKLARTCVFQTQLSNLFCRVSVFYGSVAAGY